MSKKYKFVITIDDSNEDEFFKALNTLTEESDKYLALKGAILNSLSRGILKDSNFYVDDQTTQLKKVIASMYRFEED